MLAPPILPAPAAAAPGRLGADLYQQTNLASDGFVQALHTDAHLKNPWGISFGPTTPFWVSDNGAGVSTLYSGQGVPFPPPPTAPMPLVVTIPPASGSGQGTPTGTVFNNTTGFTVTMGMASSPALFLFATLDGTISGWTPKVDPASAVIAVNNAASATYTGLTLGSNAAGTFLYAANARGSIDVFDGQFKPAHLQGSFTDPNIPSGYTPYNIQNIAGDLVVTYAVPPPQAGTGFVDVFDTNGNLLRRLVSGSPLNAPWGVALAPGGFGKFSNALLVGNVNDGNINAFNFQSGVFRGTLETQQGQPFQEPGLWALAFGNGGPGFDPGTLYFVAGIGGYHDGLFGSLTPGS
jgi:uncharacterized protein (TIGR03118 family)